MNLIKQEDKIYYEENGEILAYITMDYVDEMTVKISHTVVSDALRGQGIAGKLVREAYDFIKTNNKN